MSYTDPNGWSAPNTDTGEPPSTPSHGNDGMGTGVEWDTADGITTTDLTRIEANIKGLHTLLCQSGTVAVKVNTPYFSAAVESTWNWTRINNAVFISIRNMDSPGHVVNQELQIVPDTVWPAEILPDEAVRVHCIFQKEHTTGASIRPGYFIMPTTNNTALICYITDANIGDQNKFVKGDEGGAVEGFSDGSGTGKGIPEQTVFWIVDRDPIIPTTTAAP